MAIFAATMNRIRKPFINELRKNPPIFKSSTYLVLIIAGLTSSLLIVASVLLLFPSVDNLKWYLVGISVFTPIFSICLYVDFGFRDQNLKGLAYLIPSIMIIISFYGWIMAPRFDTPAGDALLASFITGLFLGLSAPGIWIYKVRREMEIENPQDPSLQRRYWSREYWSNASPILSSDGAIPSASILIVLSAGIMLWADFAALIDPAYGGINTLEDLIGFSIVLILNLGSIIMLAYAWNSGRIRYFLLAATLSGFSITAPLSILAEIALWRAYKRHHYRW